MKRVICFSVFMVIAMIMTTSCTKCSDDPTYPTQVETVLDLNGSWEFVNLTYVGGPNYTTCEELTGPLTVWKKYLMSFDINSTSMQGVLKDKCINPTGTAYTIKQLFNIPGKFQFGFYNGDTPIQLFVESSYDASTGTLILTFTSTDDAKTLFLTVKKK
jgi:hypothetical protein